MPSIGTFGGTLPLGPKSLKVKHQAFPQDGSTELKQPALASLPVTGLEPRVKLHMPGRSENFLVDTGATYSVLISYSYSGDFSSQICAILCATGKKITKRFTQACLCCWDGQIFSHQFLVFPEGPTPLLGRDILTKLVTTLVMGSFSAPEPYNFWLLLRNPLHPLQ